MSMTFEEVPACLARVNSAYEICPGIYRLHDHRIAVIDPETDKAVLIGFEKQHTTHSQEEKSNEERIQ